MHNDAPQPPVLSPAETPTSGGSVQIEALTRVCVDDLLSAFGLGNLRRGRRPLELLSRVPARRLAHQVATYDRIVGELGLGAGGAWMLERMARSVEVEGQENIPRQGPLLLVANHPGLTDTVVLFAAMPRSDLRVVAAERPFLDVLPNTSQYLLTMSETSSERFRLLRSATRHLRGGGAILTFPAGRIEPDPAVLPGAIEALEHWSASADLFARLVPRLAIVPAVVSGVLSPAALRNPLTFLRRRPKDRQWLAATLQIMIPALRNVSIRVAFGRPVYADAQGATGQDTLGETQRLIEQCGAG
jgi:hypothetical protein